MVPLHSQDSHDFHFSCPACKDEGVPARVVAIDAHNRAVAHMEGGEREVSLDLLDDVQVGDFVLVHLDTAIAKLKAEDVIEE